MTTDPEILSIRVTAEPRDTARRVRVWAVVGLLCLVAMIPGSCGWRSKIRAARPVPPDTASPVVRGARDGLELWWWVVTDPRSRGGRAGAGAAAPIGPTGAQPSPEPAASPESPPAPVLEVVDLKFDLEDVLLTYLDREVPMSAPDRERWRKAGFRVIAVPVADLDRIQSLLRTVGTAQRQWLGERPDWTDAVTGPAFERPRTLRTADETEIFSPGALRLLLRCWVAPSWGQAETGNGGAPPSAPTPDPSAVLRVELVPEHRPADRWSGRAGWEDRRADPDADLGAAQWAGRPLTSLIARLSLRDGEACLIVPESPDADWSRPQTEAPALAFGPQAPPVPTIGEAMLSSAAFEAPARKVRVVLVLIPRIPERFRLSSVGE